MRSGSPPADTATDASRAVSSPGQPSGRGEATAERKRERERLILAATRELFDSRGVREALIDDIAKSVGINRAIIYRHFTGKEELFALTQVGYLEELAARLSAADAALTERSLENPGAEPTATDRLKVLTAAYVDFGLEYPAFIDCSQALMSKPGTELIKEVGQDAALRLGRAMTGALSHVVRVLEAGRRSGEFHVDDVDLLANTLYAQGLGGIALARVGVLIKESAPGVPAIAQVSADQVKGYLVSSAVALAARA